jgi:ATP synthase F1 complex assembly factor 2
LKTSYHVQSLSLETHAELYEYQAQKWDPVLEWFERTFHGSLPTTDGVFLDDVSAQTKRSVERYLSSHNQSSLFGFQFVIDNLKSITLSLALVHKQLSVSEAVTLSRLEQEFQIARWGSVEWAHDTDLMLLRSRTSAGLIFFLLNQESTSKQKRVINQQN